MNPAKPDLDMLHELLDYGELSKGEADAFAGMADSLESGKYKTLTPRQREWAAKTHSRMLLGDPTERNAGVKKGRVVATPAVLFNLPKKPPTRLPK